MQGIIQEITLLKVITYGLQEINQLDWKLEVSMLAYKFDMGRGIDRQPILIQDFSTHECLNMLREGWAKHSAYNTMESHIYRHTNAMEGVIGQVFKCLERSLETSSLEDYFLFENGLGISSW